MIDASAAFIKDGPKNRLRAQDIHRIVDAFNRQLEIPKYSRMVSFEEIEKNEFNLNLPRYIDGQQTEDLQDIEGHLKGGIPERDVDALAPYWEVCPGLRDALFRANRPGYVDLTVEKSAIKATIYEHSEFAAFISSMNGHFDRWRKEHAPRLKAPEPGFHPKQMIAGLSEDLLDHYRGKALIDAYDVYQHLMDYWEESMQDDCYLISADGWKAETSRVTEKKNGKERDKGWVCDLVPKALLIARCFQTEQSAIDIPAADLEGAGARLAELEEEHSGDEGFFSELEKINRPNVAARLKEIEKDSESKEQAAVFGEWLKWNAEEADLRRKLKDAEAALDSKVYAQYPKLGEAEVRSLVVDGKWLATLDAAAHGEMDRVSQALTLRVKELAERYGSPLPEVEGRVAEMESKVRGHLERMGFAWK